MIQTIHIAVVVICVQEVVIVLPERHAALLEDPDRHAPDVFQFKDKAMRNILIAFLKIYTENYENYIFTYNNTNVCTALCAEKNICIPFKIQ